MSIETPAPTRAANACVAVVAADVPESLAEAVSAAVPVAVDDAGVTPPVTPGPPVTVGAVVVAPTVAAGPPMPLKMYGGSPSHSDETLTFCTLQQSPHSDLTPSQPLSVERVTASQLGS
jgi:hypothetical protein